MTSSVRHEKYSPEQRPAVVLGVAACTTTQVHCSRCGTCPAADRPRGR